MTLPRFGFIAALSLVLSLPALMFGYVAAAVDRVFLEPLREVTARPLNALEHGEIAGVTETIRSMSSAQVVSFGAERSKRIVDRAASAFDLSVPRQGGLLAA